MDQKIIFGGPIGYSDSYLEFLNPKFKVLRLHAILHDAARAVRAHSGKGAGYCYMIGGGPNSCLLGHLTGLLFCLYKRLFLLSIFNSVDFWSSMSCIVLDIELADKNVFKEMGDFNIRNVQGYSFCPPKKCKPTKQAVWCTRNLHEIVWNSGRLHYSELPNILPRDIKGEFFAKRTEKCKILASLMDKEVETLDDHGCPKVQDLVDEEIRICSRYPFRRKTTLHCAERKAKMFGNCIMHHLKL